MVEGLRLEVEQSEAWRDIRLHPQPSCLPLQHLLVVQVRHRGSCQVSVQQTWPAPDPPRGDPVKALEVVHALQGFC
eukprot:264249-Hanusia_phi.AAC.3